ncbi:MAG: HvfC/BufC family peptide modification chaperone [Methylococcaceae bacterium]
MEDFYAFVRNQTHINNHGRGAEVYRFLVRLGVDEMLRSRYPQVYEALDKDDWETLLTDFIKKSSWSSPYVIDLENEFEQYLIAQTVSGHTVSDGGAVEN